MRSRGEVEKDIGELKRRMESLETDIPNLEGELKKVKQANARLLSKYAGSGKKPQSLNVQRTRIIESQLEIEQTREALAVLKNELEVLEKEKLIIELRRRLDEEYRPASEKYLASMADILAAAEEIAALSEKLRESVVKTGTLKNPLTILADVLRGISREQYESLQFDFEQEAAKHKFATRLIQAEKRFETFRGILKFVTGPAVGNEMGGPDMPSRIRLIADLLPGSGKGTVSTGGRGPKNKVTPAGRPDIEVHPWKYDPVDVRRHKTQRLRPGAQPSPERIIGLP